VSVYSGKQTGFKKENNMAAKGKVLVLVSSGYGLPLKDGKVYAGAGYYLNELNGSGSRPDAGGLRNHLRQPQRHSP
jgi:hypothetical protein